jgi:DNA polymerase III delta prime subunit
MNYIPWVEKYRPNSFQNIVLSNINRRIFLNILKQNYFPNMILYGPPGTGKTTTIINLINAYQENNNQKNKGLMIHLNASDDRGIDIIRNNINNFVNSKNLFNQGTKFIILDEVDYMTKNAQQALKYLLHINTENVRFCLICNYISKIDESLQNEFMKLRFDQLPEKEIINFLQMINKGEDLNYSASELHLIRKLYKSDIRSMINYIQSNQNVKLEKKILDDNLWNSLTRDIISGISIESFKDRINNISVDFNVEIKNIIKEYLNYIIFKDRYAVINKDILNATELLMHLNENVGSFNTSSNNIMINYIYYSLINFFEGGLKPETENLNDLASTSEPASVSALTSASVS